MKSDKRHYVNLPLDSLISPAFQSHIPVDEKTDIQFLELVDNIKTYGVNDPIIVRKKDGKYEIVNGDRRVRAARVAGLIEIPAQIKELSDEEALFLQANENLHNQGYSDTEKTRLVSHIATTYKLDSLQIAKKLTRSVSWVLKYLPLEFKDARMAALGKAGGEARAETFATRRVATQEPPSEEFLANLAKQAEALATSLVECIGCKQKVRQYLMSYVKVYTSSLYEGPYCPTCAIKRKNEERKNIKENPKMEETSEPKKQEESESTYTQSKEEFFTKLANEGLAFETGARFSVVETVPDGFRRDVNLLVYLDDGKGENERIRKRYEELHLDVRILTLNFNTKDDKEKARLKIHKEYKLLKKEHGK